MARANRRKKRGNRAVVKSVLSVLLGLILSSLGALVLFALFSAVMVLCGYSLSDILVANTVFIQLAFFISFYFIYAARLVGERDENYPLFSLKRELLEFFGGKGRYYLSLALLLAFINEIALLKSAPESNLVSISLAMIFPLVGSIKISVLRSVLNYLVLAVGSVALVLLKAFFVRRAEIKAISEEKIKR